MPTFESSPGTSSLGTHDDDARILDHHDVSGINQLLSDLSAAYQRRDLDVVKSLWPTLSAADLRRIEDAFRAAKVVRYSFSALEEPRFGPVASDGRGSDVATLLVQRSGTMNPFSGGKPLVVDDHLTMRVVRAESGWTVQSAEYTRDR